MEGAQHPRRIARLAVALGSLFGWSGATPDEAEAAITTDPLDETLLNEVNAVRTRHGMRAVVPSRQLDRAATIRSRDMARRGYFGHTLPGGTPYWARVKLVYPVAGFRTWLVGENLFWSARASTPRSVVRAWVNSLPHRRVLLRPYWRDAGVGAVRATSAPGFFRGRTVTIVTLELGLRR
jgi:uncharacterized protein YkwD